jgi:hypothetical protein
MSLYHYCCSHGLVGIGERGLVRPGTDLAPDRDLPPWSGFVWFTDMTHPDRASLGLTSVLITCDRLAYRYRSTDDSLLLPYTSVARVWDRGIRDLLETAPGARPAHWWLSAVPVPVEFDLTWARPPGE